MDTKIVQFNKRTLEGLRPEMVKALSEVGKQYGISFSIGNMRYQADSFHVKVDCVVNNSDMNDQDAVAKTQWNKYCHRYNMTPDDFGKKFTTMNNRKGYSETYTIAGCKPRSHRYPILAKGPDGKVWKMPAHTVKNGI